MNSESLETMRIRRVKKTDAQQAIGSSQHPNQRIISGASATKDNTCCTNGACEISWKPDRKSPNVADLSIRVAPSASL